MRARLDGIKALSLIPSRLLATFAWFQIGLGYTGAFLQLGSPDWTLADDGIRVLQLTALVVATFLLFSGKREAQRAHTFGWVALLSATSFARDGIRYLAEEVSPELFRIPEHLALDAFFPFYLFLFSVQFPRAFLPRRAALLINILREVLLLVGITLFLFNLLRFAFPAYSLFEEFNVRNRTGTYSAVLYASALPALAVLLYRTRFANKSERNRVKVFVVGLLVSLVPPLIFIVVTSISPAAAEFVLSESVEPFIFPLMQTFVISAPLLTSYAVLVENILPVNVILNRTLRFALGKLFFYILLLAPVALTILYLYLSSALELGVIFSTLNGLFLLIAIAIAVVVFVIRKSARLYLEKLFFRSEFDGYSLLTEFHREITESLSPEDLSESLSSILQRSVLPETASLLVLSRDKFLVDPTGKLGTVDIESKLGKAIAGKSGFLSVQIPISDSDQEGARWVYSAGIKATYPVILDEKLYGVLCLGNKKSELAYDLTDERFISSVAQLIAGKIARMTEEQLDIDLGNSTVYCLACGKVREEEVETCTNCNSVQCAHTGLPILVNNQYYMERYLGGSMGAVYLVEDIVLQRKVVLKTIAIERSEELAFLRNEAKLMASVHHPQIAIIYDYISYQSLPILVCEYLAGGSLDQRIVSEKMPIQQTLRLAAAVANALGHLHENGIVHGDVKPSNIGFDLQDSPKLLDFGLSTFLTRSLDDGISKLEIGGTVAYMSPEQLSGAEPGPGSDLWSLTVCILECLLGSGFLSEVDIKEMHYELNRIAKDIDAQYDPVHQFFSTALSEDEATRPQSSEEYLFLIRQSFPDIPVSSNG